MAGIRAAPWSPHWDGGRLRHVDAGSLPLVPGDWVVVAPDGADSPAGRAWIGEVVVAPEQVIEAATVGPLPRVERLATSRERPAARTEGAGLRLLQSLGVPAWATASPSAAAPEDDRPQQQEGREQAGADPAPPQR